MSLVIEPNNLLLSLVGTLALTLAACGNDGSAGSEHSDARGSIPSSASSRASSGPSTDYPAIAQADVPDPCLTLTEEMAEAGLGANVRETNDDPMGCDWLALEPRTSFDQPVRMMTLTASHWPTHLFSSRELNEREIREAIATRTNHDGLNPLGLQAGGRHYMADEEATTYLIILPKVDMVRTGSEFPGGELVVLAKLNNPNMPMPQRLGALREAAGAYAEALVAKARES
ncbi:hypothetical protein WJS89_06240 [Sphingomicrobium sp. XHP0235]|uniref:hypothetical protein n=1 Tax=Sphingomicrobium aquimarinum TaxID=3133971 RepID=UPI0031FEA9D9